MKQKSLLATIIAVAVLFIPGVQDIFGHTWSLWIGTFYVGLVAFWKRFYDSNKGEWVFSGWKPLTLILNFGMFIIALIAAVSEHMQSVGILIPAAVAIALVKLTAVINSIILVINSGVLGGLTGLNKSNTQ